MEQPFPFQEVKRLKVITPNASKKLLKEGKSFDSTCWIAFP